MSEEKQDQPPEKGKHTQPNWPEDTGKALDDWLEQSNREAEGK